MILAPEDWMNIRRFRVLHETGSTYAEIARECRVDPRTVKKYRNADAGVAPPRAPSRAGCQPQVIASYVTLIETWLRGDLSLKGSVMHERLVADHGFLGHYQRVKMHLATVRPLIEDELFDTDDNNLRGLHRRFEVVAGAQGQVDWGEEGDLFALGVKVYSFHMTLSYSRDPFCCFTTSMDLATFWDCHRRAFAHLGVSQARSSTTGPGRSSSGTSHRARPSRCTRRPRRSPSTTASSSTPLPPTAPPGRDVLSGRC